MQHQMSPPLTSPDVTALTAFVPLWDAGEETQILSRDGEYIFGSEQSCDVRIPLNGVAPEHCQVVCRDCSATIVPLSDQHVRVNDVPVVGPHPLRAGDILAVGPATFRVESRHEGVDVRQNPQTPSAGTSTSVSQTDLAVTPPGTADHPEVPKGITSVSPCTDGHAIDHFASEIRQQALDDQERGLSDWQSHLEQRTAELDEQSALLTERQTQLEREAERVEARQQESLDDIRRRQDQLTQELETREAELTAEREKLLQQAEDISQSAARIAKQEGQLTAAQARTEAEQRDYVEQLAAARDDLARKEATLTKARYTFEQYAATVNEAAAQNAAHSRELEAEQAEFVRKQQEFENQLAAARDEMVLQEAALDEENKAIEQFAASVNESAEYNAARARELEKERAEFARQQQEIEFQLAAAREDLARQEATIAEKRSATEQYAATIQQSTELAEAGSLELEEQRADIARQRQEHDGEMAAAREELARQQAALAEDSASFEHFATNVNETLEQIAARSSELDEERAEFTRQRQEHESELAAAREELARRETILAENQVSLQQFATTANELAEQNAARARELEEERAEFARQQREHESQLVASTRNAETKTARHKAESDAWQRQLEERFRELERHEAELAAREVTGADKLATRSAELDTRELQVASELAEIELRYEEIAGRVQLLKRLIADSRAAKDKTMKPEVDTEEDGHELAQQLNEARQEAGQLSAERDELTSALMELRTAFDAAREELAGRIEPDPGNNDSSMAQELHDALAERDQQLAAANEALAANVAETRQLEVRLQELAKLLDSERDRFAEQLRAAEGHAEDMDTSAEEEDLLRQVEALKAELANVPKSDSEDIADSAGSEQKYEQLIRDLSQQLDAANAQLQSSREVQASDSEYLALIAELKHRVEEQEHQIRSLMLREQVTSDDPADAADAEEIRRLHREIDERTNVLDGREEDLRERQRMFSHTQEELENQRRQLLEARQQLEVARAEMHVSREQSEQSPDSAVETSFPSEPTADTSAHDESEETAPPLVRSELAELFGIGDTVPSGKWSTTVSRSAEDPAGLTAVDDYSQETAAAVSMSFSGAENVLLEALLDTDDDGPGDDMSEDDDHVASHMERMLVRNRQNAGGSLPNELTHDADSEKRVTKLEEPEAEPDAEPVAPPRTKSFLEAYMAGEYEPAVEPAVEPVSDVVSTPPARAIPSEAIVAATRQKIDLEALRNDMNSFRQLSTRSVENALASHAKRQEKGGIATRTTILTAMGIVCVFMTSAALLDVIPFGIPVWFAIFATGVSAGELALKLWTVNNTVKLASGILAATPAGPEPDTTRLSAEEGPATAADTEDSD